MNALKGISLPGSRILKTAIAIFITAWVCELLNWPPVFAVITAVVTVEPTVSDSIRKGIVRFPASAIGSAYAVLFIYLFGNAPITYTLAAFFTIATCYRLKLHAGLLVATLTAIAMVEVIHSNYLISFFIRLGTTTVGLLVSTAVNFIVFPPDYKQDIIHNIQKIAQKTSDITQKVFMDILQSEYESYRENKNAVNQLTKKLQQTETLIRFQRDESRFHPLVGSESQLFQSLEHQLAQLKLFHYHLNNVTNFSIENIPWQDEHAQEKIGTAVETLTKALTHKKHYDHEALEAQLNILMNLYWNNKKQMNAQIAQQETFFPPNIILLYELVSMYQLVFYLYDETET